MLLSVLCRQMKMTLNDLLCKKTIVISMIGLQKGLAGPKCKGQNIKKEKVKSFSSGTFFSKDNNARLKFKGTEY